MPNTDSRGGGQPEPLLGETLTRREREVLALLAQGLSGPEIAQQLTLGLSSVKSHIQHLYGKLGVNSKRQALARASELGLILPVPTVVSVLPKVASGPRRNLPVQLTRFFGREQEIADVQASLAENRLVTLTGAGGVGKTRLLLRVAESIQKSFYHGPVLSSWRQFRTLLWYRRWLPTRSTCRPKRVDRRWQAWRPTCERGKCSYCWITVSIWRTLVPSWPKVSCSPVRGCASWPLAGSHWLLAPRLSTLCRRCRFPLSHSRQITLVTSPRSGSSWTGPS